MPDGRPRPSVSLAISDWCRSAAFFCASLIAARIRSSATSFSDGTKIDSPRFLRRAEKRGKKLPEQLYQALKGVVDAEGTDLL